MKIIISGVVGVGKSTISHLIAERFNLNLIQEPVNENPYLSDFYNNQKKYAFQMQIWLIMERTKQLKLQKSLERVVVDRSILEDKIFVEVLKKQGNFSERDYETYCDFYNEVIIDSIYNDKTICPDLIIYLKADTQTAIDRIAKRGRESEKHVDFGYWDLLNKEYENWYQNNRNRFNFLTIKTDNLSIDEIMERIVEHINKMK